MAMMNAAIFVEPGRIVLDDKPIPDVGPQDALLRVATTTICGTDVSVRSSPSLDDSGRGDVRCRGPA